jgi:hypothetical protein
VRLLAPGPWMAIELFRSGSGLCRSTVPLTEKPMVNLSEGLPASAARIAARSVPGPDLGAQRPGAEAEVAGHGESAGHDAGIEHVESRSESAWFA